MLVARGWYAHWYDLFLKYKPEILQLFAFKDKVEQNVNYVLGTEEVLRLGVHIRRGDYATFMDGRFLYSDEQYIRIIRQFQSLRHDEKLIVYPKSVIRNIIIRGQTCNVLKMSYLRNHFSNGGH